MSKMRDVVSEAFGVMGTYTLWFDAWRGRSDGADVIVIPDATIGLHVSTIDRSNYRSILRDFPFLEEDSRGPYLSYLSWRVEDDWHHETAETFHERLELVRDLIGGLVDYCVYDESDHSELEVEDTEEAWEQWAGPTCEKCDERMDMPVDTDVYPEHEGETVHFPDEYLDAAKAQHQCA